MRNTTELLRGRTMTLPPFSGEVASPSSGGTDLPPAAPPPGQVEMVLTALEAGLSAAPNRRAGHRRVYRVTAGLRLFSDRAGTPTWVLHTRDVHARGLGFITQHRLPLGHGGVVELPAAGDTTVSIPCTLLRCREAAPGWFEGALYFNRDQPQFAG